VACASLAVVGALGCASEPRDRAGSSSPIRAALTDPNAISAERGLDPGDPVDPDWGLEPVAMATGDGVHMVVWSNFPVVVLRVRASDNVTLGSFTINTETGPCPMFGLPAIGYTAGRFLITWTARRGMASDQLCAVRVLSDGTVLDDPPIVIGGGTAFIGDVAIGGDGTNFLVVWSDFRFTPHTVLFAARVRASDGVPLSPTGGSLIPGSRFGIHTTPAVAFDGTTWLAAWDGFGKIFATRIAQDGTVLDSTSSFTTVGIEVGDGRRPAVAFDGTNHQVVAVGSNRLWRARIRPSDGAKLDATPVDLVQGTGTFDPAVVDPAVVFDGTDLAVLWRGTTAAASDRARIHFMRFTPEGQAQAPVVVDDNPGERNSANALGAASGKSLAAWSRKWQFTPPPPGDATTVNEVQVASVEDSGGSVSVSPALVSRAAATQGAPVVSFDGQRHLLAFTEFTGRRYQVRAARVRDSDGEVLDERGIALGGGDSNQLRPAVASNGTNHLVVWLESGRLRAVRVRGDDGAVLDDPPLTLPVLPLGAVFSVACDGQDFLVWWLDGLALVGVRVRGTDGEILDATPRTLRNPAQFANLAFVDSHYVASWLDFSTPGTVFAQRFDRDGTPVDPPVVVADLGGNVVQDPRVVPMGELAMVLWRQGTGLMARRLRASDGTSPDQAPITVAATFAPKLAAAFDGEHVLLAFTDLTGPFPEGTRVRLARLTQTGTLLDPTGVVVADDPHWDESDPVLSPSPLGRTLVAYKRRVPLSRGAPARVRWRWVGAAFPPAPDAAADTQDGAAAGDAAVEDARADAAPADDGGTTPDTLVAPVPDAATAPEPDAAAPPDTAPGPALDAGAPAEPDAAAPPDTDATADTIPADLPVDQPPPPPPPPPMADAALLPDEGAPDGAASPDTSLVPDSAWASDAATDPMATDAAPPADTGAHDDAPPADTGLHDAARPADTGTPDAAPPADTGTHDAAPPADTGARDAAGTSLDGATHSTDVTPVGPPRDGGDDGGVVSRDGDGCSCQVGARPSSGGGAIMLVGLAALAIIRRPRRRRAVRERQSTYWC
jgi:MYXO-CTERM domain-containing protein